MPCMAFEILQEFMGELRSAISVLTAPNTDVGDYVGKLRFLNDLKLHEKELDSRCQEITNLYDVIHETCIPVPDFEAAELATLDGEFHAMKNAVEEIEGMRDETTAMFIHQLEGDFEKMQKGVVEVRNAAQHEMILDDTSNRDEVVSYLTGLKEQVDEMMSEQGRINNFRANFKAVASSSEELKETAEEVGLKLNMWLQHAEFDSLCKQWQQTPIHLLNLSDVDESAQQYHKMCTKMERGLPLNKKVPKLRQLINQQKEVHPMLVALSSSALKERHWLKIEGIVGKPLPRQDGERDKFTLEHLLQLNVEQYKDQIVTVSTEAAQEAALEEMLAKVNSRWAEIDFVCVPYKDSKDMVILSAIDEITMALEDSMVTMSSILSSRCWHTASSTGKLLVFEDQSQANLLIDWNSSFCCTLWTPAGMLEVFFTKFRRPRVLFRSSAKHSTSG